ncbi:hypothetical protein ACERII_06315 [Evansella sp. AB-rgal1]|uniref:hypothetical protein n=1 Tax=Evansella sp. AB-rgal1 TaxID=3242696 RepID=UPI00359D4ADD
MGISIVLLAVIIIVIFFSTKGKTPFFNGYRQRIKSTIIVYISILILSTGLFYILQTQLSTVSSEDNTEIISELNNYVNEFYNIQDPKELDESDKVVKLGEWSFPYSDEELEIFTSSYHLVRVQQKETSDETIDVSFYTTRAFQSGIEYTELLQPPTVRQANNSLLITDPDRVEISFAKFDREFTINQFTGGSMMDDNHETSTTHFGDTILFVKVPSNVNVSYSEDGNIYIVEDE